MTPKHIIEALINSPKTLERIIESLTGANNHLEHYWALNVNDEKVEMFYEYYGYSTHIPNKFIDGNLIPLHSHVSLDISPELMSLIKFDLSKMIRHELSPKQNKLHGSSYPSKEDLMKFIWDEHKIFGVCSLYNGYAKISFYEPTALGEEKLKKALKELFDWDNSLTKLAEEEIIIEDRIIETMKHHLNMWKENENLFSLLKEPYSAHLIVPL